MKELLDKKMTQEDIANVLHIDRSQVSKRVKLLDLIPELFKQLEKGELKPSIARELAGLPKKEQKKFLERDSVTLKEAQGAKREQTLKTLKKVPASMLEPKVDLGSKTTEPEAPVETKGSERGETALPDFDLNEKEKGVLKHAYKHGLLDPGNIKRKPMDKVAKDYGVPKTTYSMHLVNARRKIVSVVCERMLK
jgi:predicted transcriptional regulator